MKRPATSARERGAGVRITGVSKAYGDTTALDDISFEVEPGELFGLIGPDGAGKSTLLRILVTVLLADDGEASLAGLDVVADYRAVRRVVGYMPGRFSLYQDLTIRENLEFFASVFGTTVDAEYDFIAPIYDQIKPFDDRLAGDLSGGMKQKLALCCALVHRPEVLLLDEPTTGVDAVSRAEFWDMLAELRHEGITTLVSTPYMDEAARCDRIALIQDGRLLREAAPPDAVAASFPFPLVRVRAAGSRTRLLEALRDLHRVERVDVFGEWIHVSGRDGMAQDDVRQVLAKALQSGREPFESLVIEPTAPGVEDTFMALMGEPETGAP